MTEPTACRSVRDLTFVNQKFLETSGKAVINVVK
jgi:hypothetical protein